MNKYGGLAVATNGGGVYLLNPNKKGVIKRLTKREVTALGFYNRDIYDASCYEKISYKEEKEGLRWVKVPISEHRVQISKTATEGHVRTLFPKSDCPVSLINFKEKLIYGLDTEIGDVFSREIYNKVKYGIKHLVSVGAKVFYARDDGKWFDAQTNVEVIDENLIASFPIRFEFPEQILARAKKEGKDLSPLIHSFSHISLKVGDETFLVKNNGSGKLFYCPSNDGKIYCASNNKCFRDLQKQITAAIAIGEKVLNKNWD